MSANVVIKVWRNIPVNLNQPRRRNKEARELFKTAEELGVELKQMHPRVKDPDLASYYVVKVSDSSETERVAARFRACRAAEAVYVKPPDELP